METWRLSRIEDELNRLDFTQDPSDPSLSDAIFSSLPMDLGFNLGSKRSAEKGVEYGDYAGDEGYSEEDSDSLPPPPQDLPPPPDELLYPNHPALDRETLMAGYNENNRLSVFPPEIMMGLSSKSSNGNVHKSIVSSSSRKSLDNGCDDKETIYSEAVISKEMDPVSQSDAAVKHITDKYDSLQRLKLTPFPAIVPPGYVNTNKSSPGKKLSLSTPAIDEPLPPSTVPNDIVHEDSLTEIRDTNHWLEMQGQGQIPAVGEKLLADSLTNQCARRPSFISSLSEQEILQVEIFYRSHKTEVFVCHCEADLLHGSVRDSKTFDNFYSQASNTSGWTLVKAGIPALVLDNSERKLYLLLAERGTGFTLWREPISHLTNYTAVQPNFHTLHLSSDHSKLIGLSFQDASGATEFIQRLNSIISDPESDILNIGKKNKKKKKDKKSIKVKKPSKADISAPCCFTHITALDRTDGIEVKDST